MKPPIIVGTGRSFFDPSVKYEGHWICTLNRAVCGVLDPTLAFFMHKTALEASMGHVARAGKVVVSDPFLTDPGSQPVWELEAIQEIGSEKLDVHKRRYEPGFHAYPLPKDREDLKNGLCHEYSVACLAISYMVKCFDVKEIWTVGMDGGRETHSMFMPSYANRPLMHRNGYDGTFHISKVLCDRLGVEWYRLNEDGSKELVDSGMDEAFLESKTCRDIMQYGLPDKDLNFEFRHNEMGDVLGLSRNRLMWKYRDYLLAHNPKWIIEKELRYHDNIEWVKKLVDVGETICLCVPEWSNKRFQDDSTMTWFGFGDLDRPGFVNLLTFWGDKFKTLLAERGEDESLLMIVERIAP